MKYQVCKRCKKEKVIDHYYRRSTGRYRKVCKVCTLQIAQINYLKTQKQRKEYAKKYYYDNWVLRNIQRKKWMKDNPELVKQYRRKYSKSKKGQEVMKKVYERLQGCPVEANKRKARRAVRTAITNGTLKRPEKCYNCNTSTMVDAHHFKGYESKNYLKVLWLCHKCHVNQHYAY